ncbi:MAG: hypothetical protein IH571_03895 [Acholeplasmataceae bacterium]|nr:hypothetical protein [Acholeplasmataceae bacterium]
MHKTNEDKINGLIKDKVKQFKIYAETYETKQFKLPDGKYQITFADMGMLHIVGPANLKITYPKGMHLSLSEALFK